MGIRSSESGVAGGCELGDVGLGTEPWYSGRIVCALNL